MEQDFLLLEQPVNPRPQSTKVTSVSIREFSEENANPEPIQRDEDTDQLMEEFLSPNKLVGWSPELWFNNLYWYYGMVFCVVKPHFNTQEAESLRTWKYNHVQTVAQGNCDYAIIYNRVFHSTGKPWWCTMNTCFLSETSSFWSLMSLHELPKSSVGMRLKMNIACLGKFTIQSCLLLCYVLLWNVYMFIQSVVIQLPYMY